mgnify:CR=1 FL=1
MQRGADHDADNNDSGVNLNSLVAEQCLYVLLTEEIPADDGREGKEQQADGHIEIAEAAEHRGKRHLGHVLRRRIGSHVAHVQRAAG